MQTRRTFLAVGAAGAAGLTLARSALASQPPVYIARGAAIRGYDPVAYFTQGDAVRGRSEHMFVWNGADWLFATAAHRDRFAANPERYAPQYGGYCAWAVSRGYTAAIDADAWHIWNDKLYLNYSRSVRRRWLQDVPGNVARGDANWPRVLNA